TRLFSDVFTKKPIPEDTLLVFVTKNWNDALAGRVGACVGEHKALVVVPVLRGERESVRAFANQKENVHVLVREVERT
ncbi:MAG: hypothetical protein K2O99_05165, partial [Lachnospiraceae bacterium]|nr:hypothetical protein [Lachnospiraceae bacterium]